jgi:type VI secretion system ImpB/VipA family protein
MPQQSGPKFIGRNRPPRVQIEYQLYTYGSMETVQLPFVMGVMADLSGKPLDPLPSVRERAFRDIDIESLDQNMKAIRPRVAFSVPNTLTGEENLPIEIVFESMADFAPDAVARKVQPLRKLLEKREQLTRLLAYMDGKEPAEKLVARLLTDKDMQSRVLSGLAQPDGEAKPTPTA